MEQSNISIRTSTPDDWDLAFSDDSKDAERGCIGHLRIDFGSSGKEFWHSWWGHQDELNTPAFESDLESVVNALRDTGVFESQSNMTNFCYAHPNARMGAAWDSTAFGFTVDTDAYTYGIRLQSKPGNYSYIYAYDAATLKQSQLVASEQQEGLSL